ncbi:MAG: type iii restriction protein res subunit, type restriction enzyme subunit [Verrucomicrobiales bacterium]|nr:type iii restriction protein res subunit, type restriction enzyme subunit [Verrucomicrobiales bacterium]
MALFQLNRSGLEQAGWRFFPEKGGPDNIICECRISKKVYSPSLDLGNDFEKCGHGFVDYLLLNLDRKPVALVEAKREGIDPLDAKEQARDYAKSLGIRHIFLSNGIIQYYWDLSHGNPTRISHLLSLEQLGEASRWNPDPQKLTEAKVDENYIAVSQDAGWLNHSPTQRDIVRVNQNIKLLRDYQLDAVVALQKAYAKGKNRFLFEMATGTGKTLLSAAVTKLFIRSANAARVLFLVDRIELENQAARNFNHYLAKDSISTALYKERRDDWINAQVVVTTIQSLAAGNRYLTEFSPNDFQLIISDEAHRTIGGNNRVIFEYFIGAKLGLTATPKDYLKGIDPAMMREDDPRELERRLLLDSYRTFGCEDGNPTFRFSLVDAVNHKPPYLVNPFAVDCRTDITTELLSQKGWAVKLATLDDNEEEEEKTFYKRDFEKRFFSDATNETFVRTFLKNAKRDPLTGEIGKTIVFAVSRKHARKLTKLLNDEIEKLHPGKYQSDFAVQITSDIPSAQDMTKKFDSERNALNGKSSFKPEFIDYNSSRTRVCVTVGMMTTGYDCEDLLNVMLVRPIFSPTDFIQIKGRGTRLYTFRHKQAGHEHKAEKDNFYLFDFFANCEYFEKNFDYGKRIQPPREGGGGPNDGEGGGGGRPNIDFTWTGPDELKEKREEQIGLQGMKIDREAFSRSFEETTRREVEKFPELHEAVETRDWQRVEAFVREHIFDKPQEFWTTEKLRDAYGVDRRLSLGEILQKVFGVIQRFPTRQDLADEDFDRFLSCSGVDGSKVHELQTLFTAYLLYPDIRAAVDAGDFGKLATDARLNLRELIALGEPQRKLALNYIKDNIVINRYFAA